jgi:hypothetical protein
MTQHYDGANLWLLLIPLLAVATYPLSLLLLAGGLIKSPHQKLISAANEVFLNYLRNGFLAALACMCICFVLLLAVGFLGGLAVMIGLMKPVSTLLTPAFLGVCGFVHLAGQIKAYQLAVKELRQ